MTNTPYYLAQRKSTVTMLVMKTFEQYKKGVKKKENRKDTYLESEIILRKLEFTLGQNYKTHYLQVPMGEFPHRILNCVLQPLTCDMELAIKAMWESK